VDDVGVERVERCSFDHGGDAADQHEPYAVTAEDVEQRARLSDRSGHGEGLERVGAGAPRPPGAGGA
jgi:hypothetical protein